MKTIFFRKHAFQLLSLSVMAVLGSSFSAVAQTVNATNTQQFNQSSETEASPNLVNIESNGASVEVDNYYPNVFTPTLEKSATPENHSTLVSESTQVEQSSDKAQQEVARSVVVPVPGTTITSSAALVTPRQVNESEVKPSSSKVAQSDIQVDPGRATRGVSSYIGIGGNIGLGGDSALGDGNFMVLSKIGLTRTLSARPSVVLGDDTAILIPVTYDFSFRSVDPFSEPLPIAPYLGGGVAIETSDDADVAFLLTGGVDVPISSQFTATAAINAAFFDDVDVGLAIGVGYNFRGFFGL